MIHVFLTQIHFLDSLSEKTKHSSLTFQCAQITFWFTFLRFICSYTIFTEACGLLTDTLSKTLRICSEISFLR